MKSLAVVLALAGALCTEAPVLAQPGRGRSEFEAARNGWLFSLSAGKQLARKTGKPLMVVVRCVP